VGQLYQSVIIFVEKKCFVDIYVKINAIMEIVDAMKMLLLVVVVENPKLIQHVANRHSAWLNAKIY